MVDNLDFTEDEIEEELAILGYTDITKPKLRELKRDLDNLIQHGEWIGSLPSPFQIATTSQLNPPAYIQEQVSVSEAFSQHPSRANDTLVLPIHQNRANAPRVHRDLYAQYSVAQRIQLPPGAPSQQQVEPKNPLIKRKVLRKQNGQIFINDESIYSEHSDTASCLEERLSDLQLSPSGQEDEDHTGSPQSLTPDSENAYESYVRQMTRNLGQHGPRPQPKSFIRPFVSQQTIKKCDPVARYFEYKRLWDIFKCPGEKDRSALRWEIKERLAYRLPPPKPQRVLVPNTYIVPTEKKRSALRWEIRHALANRIPPFHYR